MKRPTMKKAAIGGGTLVALTAATVATVAAARKRYYNGQGHIVQLHNYDEGAIVVISCHDRERVFWIPPADIDTAKRSQEVGSPVLHFQLDRLHRRPDDLLIGRLFIG